MGLLVTEPLLAAEMKFGESAAYRIELQLVVDTPTRPQPELAIWLAEVIRQRVDATLSPFWDLEILVPRGTMRHRLLSLLDSAAVLPVSQEKASPWDELVGDGIHGGDSAEEKLPDKRMFLSVTALPAGYQLRCCEWDGNVHRWGPLLQRTQAQRNLLAESCFHLLREVFAPLAVVHIVAKDDGQVHQEERTHQEERARANQHPRTNKQVVLQFKGSQLISESVEQLFLHSGDVFQPLLRRTDRSGDLLGVSEVPWTYLALHKGLALNGLKSKTEKPSEGNPASRRWLADIHSGLRRPFGIRLRGHNELLALAMHTVRTKSQVRFHARHNPAQALVGYEVFQQQTLENSGHLLGLTNSRGMISVDQGQARIITLLLRSDGRLLAKVPLVPGAARLVEVPIVDDMARLQAQARLVEVREQLVDLVARRNILLARARHQFSEGHLEQAQELLHKLDALPSRAQFNQILSAAEKQPSSQSKDPQVQARIEKLFTNTRSLLGRSLNTRPVSDLQDEVNKARRNPSE